MHWIKRENGQLDAAEILQFETAGMLNGIAILVEYQLPGLPGSSKEQFALPLDRAKRLAREILEAVNDAEEYQKPKN